MRLNPPKWRRWLSAERVNEDLTRTRVRRPPEPLCSRHHDYLDDSICSISQWREALQYLQLATHYHSWVCFRSALRLHPSYSSLPAPADRRRSTTISSYTQLHLAISACVLPIWWSFYDVTFFWVSMYYILCNASMCCMHIFTLSLLMLLFGPADPTSTVSHPGLHSSHKSSTLFSFLFQHRFVEPSATPLLSFLSIGCVR